MLSGNRLQNVFSFESYLGNHGWGGIHLCGTRIWNDKVHDTRPRLGPHVSWENRAEKNISQMNGKMWEMYPWPLALEETTGFGIPSHLISSHVEPLHTHKHKYTQFPKRAYPNAGTNMYTHTHTQTVTLDDFECTLNPVDSFGVAANHYRISM